MQNIIQLSGYMNELGNIMMIEFKFLQFEQVLYVTQVAGYQVIHADYLVSLPDKTITQMRPQETGCTRN